MNIEDFLKSIENNNETYTEIKNFINECNGEFLLLKADQNKGYKFGYILYLPQNIKGRTLILHGNNCAFEEGNILNWASAILETSKHAGYNLVDFDLPIIVPVVSNYIHPQNNNGKEYFPLQASRNVLFSEDIDNTYYKMFEQLNNIIEDAKKIVYEKRKIIIEEKIIAHGFSSSAKFVLRYATCYPKRVKLLIAGGFGVQNILPLKTININGEEINLLFPVGVYDIKSITNQEFDENSFREMTQFYFMGELEDSNNDTAFSSIHCDKNIQEIYEKIFGRNMLPIHSGEKNRWDIMQELLKKLNYSNIIFKLYKNVGHNATAAKEDIREMIEKNICKD